MSHKKSRTSQPVVFNSIKFNPANFGQVGFAGSNLISVYALDCALNQGLVTGKKLMGEKVRTLPLATVQGAVPPGLQHPWGPKVNHPGRFRPHPLLLELSTEPGQYILVAGADLVQQAASAGAARLACVVIPCAEAMKIGRKLIDGFAVPPNGQVTLDATTPAAQPTKQSYAGKDHSEKLDEEDHKKNEKGQSEDDAPRKKPSQPASPAVSQTGITQGLDPRANLLLSLAIHAVTVEDGEAVAYTNYNPGNGAVPNTLSPEDQEGLDIVIKYVSREAGAPGPSLHEFALTMLLYHLFQRVRKMAPVADRRRAGHSIANDKRGTSHWPGSPGSFQNWVETRKALFDCSNEFWNKAIPDALFSKCVALRYGVAEPTPVQLENYLFKLVEAAFKALDLAGRQTSNLRKLHEINFRSKQRTGEEGRRRIINEAVDGILNPEMGERYQVNEVDWFLLAVLGRLNPAKIRRDKAHQSLTFQWLVAIGDLVRTGKMIVTCLMAQELILVAREGKAERSIDAGWVVFDATLALAVKERCGWNKAYRELLGLCEGAMRGSHAMIVCRSSWGKAVLVAKPLDEPASRAAETPILLF